MSPSGPLPPRFGARDVTATEQIEARLKAAALRLAGPKSSLLAKLWPGAWPDPVTGQSWRTRMAVSQDVQDFCTELRNLKAAFDADKAQAIAGLQAQLAQAQQDHADDVAALKAALADVQPPAPTPPEGGGD